MTLFDANGHVTDAALAALVENALCEAQRLQLAEHLTECDACLLRMTALQMPQQQPQRPLVEQALQQLQKRRTVEFIRRCGIAAAAACFMLFSWRMDLFEKLGSRPAENPQLLQQFSARFVQGFNAFNDRVAQSLRDSFDRVPATDFDDEQQQNSDMRSE